MIAKFSKLGFCCSMLLLILSCTDQTAQKIPVLFSGNIMTINYRILVGQSLDLQQREVVQQIIQETFAEIDSIYNKWNPQSEISQLNQLKAGEKKTLSWQLFCFLERTDDLVMLTNGKFDPTIEPLQQLWKDRLEKGGIPDHSEIEELRPCLGWDKIHFSHQVFYKDDSRTRLDFGGIAKGLCVDLMIDHLAEAGFKHLYVEWGGEIRATGEHPAGRPWSIFISRMGDSNPENAIAKINLIEQAIATSGDYFQNWTIWTSEGKQQTYCHVFDPAKLEPLIVKPGSVASASLVANECLTADALAKVLMLFDSAEEAQKWVEQLREREPGITCWIVTRE